MRKVYRWEGGRDVEGVSGGRVGGCGRCVGGRLGEMWKVCRWEGGREG